MTAFTLKLLAAFAFGMACAEAMSRLLRLLPLPEVFRKFLGFVIALPPAAIALAMYCCGTPDPALPAGPNAEDRTGLLIPFLVGIASGPAASFVLKMFRNSLHKVAGIEPDLSDDD